MDYTNPIDYQYFTSSIRVTNGLGDYIRVPNGFLSPTANRSFALLLDLSRQTEGILHF